MGTVIEIWRNAVTEPRDFPAFLVEEEDGRWREVGWSEAGRRVDELAAGFLSLGIAKGDRVSISSRSRLEWTLCDFALASIGAIVVPLYPTSSAKECAYILENAGACAVVCEDAEQVAKLAPLRSELPALAHVLTVEAAGEALLTLDELAERGQEHLREHPDAVESARAAIDESDELTYIYTSGTTGPPKGCVLLHRNAGAPVEMLAAIPNMFGPGDRVLLFLPLAHTFARLVVLASVREGITLAFCPDVARVADALQAVQPTVFPSVPRLYEKMHTALLASFDEAAGPKRKLIDWALRVGYKASAYRQAKRGYPPGLALQFKLADRLVYSKVKARLGGKLRIAISGAAPISKEVLGFFHALDILVLEGYGLTESASGGTVNRPGNYRLGTVGLPLPGLELKLAEEGEILIRGDNVFAGYYRNEEATREVLSEDGWLLTGDVGTIDADGFLTITDRKKDIIVTAGGKNISPQNLENELKSSPYVSQVLVIGDRRPYLTALITVDEAGTAKVARAPEEVRAVIERVVDEVNQSRGRVEQVKRFAILSRDFSQEEGELTPTLKLRRRVCEEHFRAEIEALYAS